MPNPTIKDQSVEDLVAALDAPIEETEAPHMTLDEFKQECLDLMQKSGYTKGETPSVISAAFDGKKADVVYQADGPDKGLEILKEYLAKNPKKAVSIAGPVAVAKPQAKPDDTYELTPSEIRKRYTVKVGPKDAPEATKKSYLKAAGRVLLFRYAHPMGRIDTELVKSEPDATIFKATVITEDGLVLAIAHSMISKDQAKQARGKHLEMAETTAIARALFLAGFGTDQPALEFDEGDELADSPVERK